MKEYFKMGVITSPHGIKGEVNVFPTTDDPQHFKEIKTCYFKKKGEYIPMTINSCKFFKGMVILGFEEITDRNDTEALRKTEIYVDRDNAVPLKEGEYYMADIIGLDVYEIDAEMEEDIEHFNPDNTVCIGKIKDYLDTPVHPVILFTDKEDNERMVPAIHEFVKKVDLTSGRVYMRLIKGM